MASAGLETSPEHGLYDEVRAVSVHYGSYLVGFTHLFGTALIFATFRTDTWYTTAHAIALAITGIMAFALNLRQLDKLAPCLAAHPNHRHANNRLWFLATLTYVGSLYGFAVNPTHYDLEPFMLLALVFGGVCFSLRTFFVAFFIMTTGICGSMLYAGKSLEFFDILYTLVITPTLGAIVCILQTQHYKNLFELRAAVREREAELEAAQWTLTAEQQKRAIAERARREIDSKLQRQNEHLQHVSRVNAMGEMVAGIAHEINQPLNAISLHSGVLRHPKTDKASRDEAVHEIVKLSSHCARIVKRLQGFVRSRTAEETRINISQIIADSIALTASIAKTHGIEVVHQQNAGNPTVVADEVQVQQVVVNLLRNALDSMQSTGRDQVIVSTVEEEKFLRIAVKDQGCGLNDETIANLFEPFFTTKPDGMGMGLAISRSIVERYGGSLDASRNRKHGMTFSFTLRKEPNLA